MRREDELDFSENHRCPSDRHLLVPFSHVSPFPSFVFACAKNSDELVSTRKGRRHLWEVEREMQRRERVLEGHVCVCWVTLPSAVFLRFVVDDKSIYPSVQLNVLMHERKETVQEGKGRGKKGDVRDKV